MRSNVSFQMIDLYSLCMACSQSMLCGRLMASLKDSGVMMADEPSMEMTKACLHASVAYEISFLACRVMGLCQQRAACSLSAGIQSTSPVVL